MMYVIACIMLLTSGIGFELKDDRTAEYYMFAALVFAILHAGDKIERLRKKG